VEELVEEREEFMVLPSGNRRTSRSSEKTQLLKPCFTTSQPTLPPLTDLKALSLSVSFNGWRFPNVKLKSWATKMSALHEPTWKKAGILQAVAASTLKITKDTDLVLGVAEKWCPDTNTFVFPWGEATVTLEDVMVLLGFSVLGSPVFAALDSSGEKILRELEKEWVKIKRDRVSFVTQVAWMGRFMDSGDDEDELEHVAFLVLWLSYFVFSSRYYHIDEAVLPIAVHLSEGFGLLQDVPCLVNRNNLSEEEAWNEYDKPIEDLTLFIPSRSAVPRVTSMFCDWWRKSFPKLQHSLKGKCVGGDCGDTSASGSRKRNRRKRVCTMGCCQTHDSDDDEDLSITIAQIRRFSIKKCSGGEDGSEPLGKKSRFEADNNDLGFHQELGLVRADENETVQPPEKEQRNEETRQTCDDELDVHGRNVEKMSMPDDGSKEPECLLHEDGGMAGEKASSEKKENDSLIQKKIASNADNNEPTPYQNLAPGGSEVAGESKRNEDVGDETVLGSEEPLKSSEKLEKRNEDVGGGNDSYEKSLHNVKKLASSIEGLALSIDEGIAKAERNVAWLKAMRAAKQKKIAAARLI
ncbi:unnamed protein product, partial [Brassica oleracea]